jgi:hypothetical protein
MPGQEFVQAVTRVLGDPFENVGEPGLRVDVVELRRLCRLPNYAEWSGGNPSIRGICEPSSGLRPSAIRHSLDVYSASKKASRRSFARKRVALPRPYGVSFARAASFSARWA